MKRYAKTQSKINKILAVVIVAAFIYTTAFGIEFSDLTWETNHKTYKNLLLYIGMLIGMGYDYWYKRKQRQQQ